MVVIWKVAEEQGRVRGPWERKVVGWNSTVQGVEEVQQEGSAMETRAGEEGVEAKLAGAEVTTRGPGHLGGPGPGSRLPGGGAASGGDAVVMIRQELDSVSISGLGPHKL